MGIGKALFILTLGAVGLTAAPSSFAQTTWTMASGYPEDSFFTRNIRAFIEEVEKETQGELTIDLHSNGSLIPHDGIKRAVRAGQVQIGEIRLAVYGNEGAMYDLDNMPNLVSSHEDAWKLMQAQKPYFDELFAEEGMGVLSYVAWPGQGFYTREPVTSLADLEGLKLRIYSQPTQKMGQMLGMDAVILPFAEVPQAFSTNLIDSMWTSAQTGTDVQAWDYVKHFTYTGSMHNKNAIIVSEDALEDLDEETQEIVMAAGERATERGWELSKQASEVKEQELRDHDMQVARAPEDVLVRMDEIGLTLIEEWRGRADDQADAVLDAYLESVGR